MRGIGTLGQLVRVKLGMRGRWGEFLWELHSLSTSGYIRSRRGGKKQELIRGAVETKKADFARALKW